MRSSSAIFLTTIYESSLILAFAGRMRTKFGQIDKALPKMKLKSGCRSFSEI